MVCLIRLERDLMERVSILPFIRRMQRVCNSVYLTKMEQGKNVLIYRNIQMKYFMAMSKD